MDISNLPKHRDIPSSSTTRPLNRATPNSPLRAIPSNLLRATLHSRHYKVILVKARHILPSNSLPLLTLDILHSQVLQASHSGDRQGIYCWLNLILRIDSLRTIYVFTRIRNW